jgi:iron only hydrogenase large subunit-like protein
MYAKNGSCPAGNLIEIMCCQGGCIAGNACLNPLKEAFKKISDYGDKSQSLADRKEIGQ